MTRAATLAEIARETGVFTPTVSKVLNGRADVASSTRERVEELLHQYGYQRRRSNSAPSSPLLELVFHELESAWAMEVIRGVENVVREEGMSVVLSESTDTHRVTRSAPEPAIPQAAVASAGPRS